MNGETLIKSFRLKTREEIIKSRIFACTRNSVPPYVQYVRICPWLSLAPRARRGALEGAVLGAIAGGVGGHMLAAAGKKKEDEGTTTTTKGDEKNGGGAEKEGNKKKRKK